MRVLITGGAGFIGSHLVEHFQGKAEVVVLDNLRTGFRKNFQGKYLQFIEGSVTDRAAVREAVRGVDFVFHLAAMISVPESMSNPTECVDINTQGTLILLQESANAGVRKLCFSSSAAVYGDNPTLPKVEEMLPEPKSPYAVTKLDGEYYCRMFSENKWLQTACMRYFNVFGPRQDPKSQYAAAVPIFIHKAFQGNDLTIYGDGQQTRDFVYVKDVVAANVFLAERGDLTGVYNVANGCYITIYELAQKIIQIVGSGSKIRFEPVRAGDIKHSYASIYKILGAGFKPQGAFEAGLRDTIDYFRREIGN